jgi:hypothetical protein
MFSNQNRAMGVFAALVVTTFLACSLFHTDNPRRLTTVSPGPAGCAVILQADGTAPPPPPPPPKQLSQNARLA